METKSLTDRLNSFFHQSTLHPLVMIGDLSRADLSLFDPIDFGMYCVVLMEEDFGRLVKNGRSISYRPDTLFSLRPGQVVSTELNYKVRPRGWILAFCPELLEKTGLGRDFYMFNFFFSDTFEAIRLNSVEKSILVNCFATILAELNTPPDYLSDQIIRLGIGQLLSYFKRFYERQFQSMMDGEESFRQKIDRVVEAYLSSGLPAQKGQPTVAWCAQQFNLSPNYFGSLVRKELHVTAQEYLQDKLIEAAKGLLRDTSMTVGEISEQLGMSYPNHFSRMFRHKVGMTPLAFRKRV
ncbi:MAG: helix-turn-helix domain-containing protein [Candidatus Cryptobacteroides sp.]